MNQSNPPSVVVLGGGSAGWITACLLAKEWGADRVTVVESPEVGIIGVGEGSTPQLKFLFDHLGIEEAEWMAACDATFKLGIRFSGWSERAGFESYFHPFPGPVDLHTEPGFVRNCALARRGFDVAAHPDPWFLATHLADRGKRPHPAESFPFPPSYGYHFDAYKLGAFLRDWAVARGVIHRQAKVAEVSLTPDGDVAALACEDGKTIAGDIFVDCSGFRSVIVQEALGEPFLSYGNALWADRAVVLPSAAPVSFRPQTEAVAMSAGWRWAIPLTTRTGNGYVYSSRYVGDEDAEAELRTAIGIGPEVEARRLAMKVGRVERSWHRNCLAAGLAQGFVEPLEATALHIVITTALEFAQAYRSGGFGPRHRDSFNARIAERYDGIRDYIVAHYRMNGRGGRYWRDCSQNHALSDRLKAMMTAWFTHENLEEANREIYGSAPAYSAASWHCLFAGYGTFPAAEKLAPLPDGLMAADEDRAIAMLKACAANFSF
ncbi:tryptophan halogenase family protein [Qipengyuania sp.]|uniref:tryptophan halogenase family protein n=1 Tax=Qipengyuania sp. TaxID=2004515 RepID=UPI0035C7F853